MQHFYQVGWKDIMTGISTLKNHGVHIDNDGWVLCPHCKYKAQTKVKPDTLLTNYPLYCQKYKKKTIVQLNLTGQLECFL